MKKPAPIQQPFGTPDCNGWLKQVDTALAGIKRTINTTAVIDFGSVSAGAQLSSAVTVNEARSGDGVQITPSVDTAGIIYTGVVTADNTVTIYAKNFTAGAINPASTTFRILVFQN